MQNAGIVPPIIIDNRPDGVTLYLTADAVTAHLEAWYVTDEDYDAYDADGRAVELRLEGAEGPQGLVVPYALEVEPAHQRELRAALLRAFERGGVSRANVEHLSLRDLVATALASPKAIDVCPWEGPLERRIKEWAARLRGRRR